MEKEKIVIELEFFLNRLQHLCKTTNENKKTEYIFFLKYVIIHL